MHFSDLMSQQHRNSRHQGRLKFSQLQIRNTQPSIHSNQKIDLPYDPFFIKGILSEKM
ncbi:hypothetical protein H744_1c0136 [Photobacterium gaetbulicola Gung47]|uniref:Uncharacterized protein n=1 Tax=Photobacterium gaetbulicola Gung47 TaxID=658445 RepID=A0A0C5WQD5_9GAMM|nr:hypothetical protein H744_1c0136 [Photobacterium gaetbulicola Gung47]